jgi:hypothetical protein
LPGQPPLVVVGIEHEVAMFLRLTSYPACVQPGVHGLPDRVGNDNMYKKALELVRSVNTGTTHHELENFDKKIGTGHASMEPQAILAAASEGRVAHLFLREIGGPDTFETLVLQTLSHGGDVKVLPETNMPAGAPVCAVFRYASAGAS